MDAIGARGDPPPTLPSANEDLLRENAALRLQLGQLEEALRAIRGGEVDALFIAGADGSQLFTLDGADRPYRALIEEMGDGAATLTPEGIVVYANRCFAELLQRPLNAVIGAPIQGCFAPEGREALQALLGADHADRCSAELDLLAASGLRVPIFLSLSRISIEGLPDALCLVATDLTWQKRSEAATLARQTLLKVIETQQRTEESLRISLATLSLHDSALGAISQGVLITDVQRRTTYVNQAFEAITGYTAADMIGRSCALLQGPGTSPEMVAALRVAIDTAQPFHGVLLNYRKDGSPFWNELSLTPVFDAEGHLTQYVGVQRDVTARRLADEQLLLAAQVFEQSGEGFIITDAARNILKVNRAFTAISGYAESEALGHNLRELDSVRHDHAFYRALWATIDRTGRWQGEVWSRRKDGSEFPQWLSMSGVVDDAGQVTHYIACFSDITQRKEAERSIRRLAHYDPLTGLPNRALLNDRATLALQMAQRSGEPMALMFIDLDHFKNVNDSLGHRIGDLLLVALASRLKAALRDQDTVSRVGGDEFVLILPGTDAKGAAHVATKVLQSALRPYQIEQHELTITPSIGIALYPFDGTDFDALAKCADTAMYRAKQDGRNTFCFFTAEMQAQSARALLLENSLRRALERDEMRLHYQPQKSLRGEQIVGVEALLRWQHPDLGMVPPAEFIPVAESSGLITALGEWVLRSALQQMKTWLDGGLPPMTIAVNLSAVQFRQANLPDFVSRVLDETGVPAQCLELELTESVAWDDPESAIAVMDKLHARGVRMSIDDFGTGYSSLSSLKRFKVYKLKIDQSFVHGVTDDAEDQAIVSAIISMARSLGMRTIAEGVETAGQMDFLRDRGCDEMQGYWFSRPLPAEQFEAFVRADAAAPRPEPLRAVAVRGDEALAA
jgi:diguanylate cyclase (GGDEF)-like protein/PAS domain S-box-containing protein